MVSVSNDVANLYIVVVVASPLTASPPSLAEDGRRDYRTGLYRERRSAMWAHYDVFFPSTVRQYDSTTVPRYVYVYKNIKYAKIRKLQKLQNMNYGSYTKYKIKS